MRVALLTGLCPPGECGVGDYVRLLSQSLNAIDIDTEIVSVSNWNSRQAVRTHRELTRKNVDVVQLHYPSLGVGAKLGPQVNALLRRCVISLHEASQAHILRRLALYPLSLYPRHVIFFSRVERDFGTRWAPWISNRSSVIPPPSNIRRIPYDGPRNITEIVSFGLIRPGNGHGRILKLAELVKAAKLPLTIRVIGTPQLARFVPYFEELRARSTGLPIIWDSGLSEQAVAKHLAMASIAYLPYPDGAAELRSSLKAALVNGLAIVTTRGSHTPANLEGVVEFCASPEAALAAIRMLLDSPQRRTVLSQRAGDYVKDWTWEGTAHRHASIYRSICRGPQSVTCESGRGCR